MDDKQFNEIVDRFYPPRDKQGKEAHSEYIRHLSSDADALLMEVKRHRWINCRDRMPGLDVPVLVYLACEKRQAVAEYSRLGDDDTYKFDDGDFSYWPIEEATYWMPLPEPPKDVR